jgi:hypothetical protein
MRDKRYPEQFRVARPFMTVTNSSFMTDPYSPATAVAHRPGISSPDAGI